MSFIFSGTASSIALTLATKLIYGILLLLCVIMGCGGGGGDGGGESTPPTSAEGFWNGTAATGQQLTGVVLDDGTYYVMYSPVGNPSLIAGYIEGIGTSNNGSFTSSNTRDFVFGYGVLSATISATYTEKQSLNGTITYTSDGTTTFSSTYDADYETQSKLSDAAGTFTGQATSSSSGSETATYTITDDGNISGVSASGCTLSGIISPRSGCNVFNFLVTFGSGCTAQGQTLTGIACYSSSTKRLYAAMPNDARTEGYFFVGVKP